MNSNWLKWMLIVAIALSPRLSTAQCGMGGSGGGGHDHGATTSASSGKSNEKKMRKSIAQLMAEPRARELLMEAVLADAPLVRGLLDRMAAIPEYRVLAAERLGARSLDTEPARRDTTAVGRLVPAPQTDAALYRCPMHPEVTSQRPGACPKCGMALQRAT